MMAGLQGAGKTTFAGKLANHLIKTENARPLMIAGDVYRPAAIDQLKVLGQQLMYLFLIWELMSAQLNRPPRIGLAREKNYDYVLIVRRVVCISTKT